MLNTVKELYHQKLGKVDVAKVKNIIKNNVNGPVTRSIVSVITDFLTTYVLATTYGPQGEDNTFARRLMETEGVGPGLLKHQILFTPIVYGLPLVLRKLENKIKDEEPGRFWQKFSDKRLISNLALDAMSGVKYRASVSNALVLARSLNLSEPWNTLSLVGIPVALGTPYALSLGKYYSKKLGVDLKKDLKYVAKKLFEGYERVAHNMGRKFLDVKTRKRYCP